MHLRNVTTKAIDECNTIPNLSFAEPGNTWHRNRPFRQAQGSASACQSIALSEVEVGQFRKWLLPNGVHLKYLKFSVLSQQNRPFGKLRGRFCLAQPNSVVRRRTPTILMSQILAIGCANTVRYQDLVASLRICILGFLSQIVRTRRQKLQSDHWESHLRSS